VKGRSAARHWIGAAIAAVFVWLIARQIHFAELARAFVQVRIGWVAAALVFFAAGYACRIARWTVMLRESNQELRWLDCAGPLLAGFAVNNVAPLRAGDVLRAFAFNRRLGASSGIVLATLVVERILDLLMVLVLLGAILALFGVKVGSLAGVGGAVLLGAAFVMLAVLVFPAVIAKPVRMCAVLFGRLAPRLGDKLLEETDKAFTMLEYLSDRHLLGKLFAWTCAAWLCEGAVFWLCAMSMAAIGVPQAGWLALPAGTLATLIPGTPGYVGTFDYFVVRAMTLLGNQPAAAAAYALLVHAVLWLPPTVAGGLYLLLHPARRKTSGTPHE
jgi:glycosyltransferase 2 family protein